MARKQINTNRKGSKFVDKVKKYLEERGYIVIKVSASKPFDLVMWDIGITKATIFECRTSGGTSKAMSDLNSKSNGILADRVVALRKGKGIRFFEDYSFGIKERAFVDLGCRG